MTENDKKKTLYVSDLDGTLLRRNEKTSDYTNRVINDLTAKGMLFSYATARSYVTATKATEGLHAKIPIITYNGAITLENETYKVLIKNGFKPEEKDEILTTLLDERIYPIVYSYQDGKEKFSYVPEKCNPETTAFLLTRQDFRKNPLLSEKDLGQGDVYYFSCIGEEEKLKNLYHRFQGKYRCIYHKDIYSGDPWLEIMPKTVSKANAVLRLKELLGAEYIVVFGDGENDLPMFEIADECYAVENAVEELKKVATGVIGSNDSDGVAKWLYHRFYGIG